MVLTFSYYNELTNHSASQMNEIWGRDRVLQIIQSVDILKVLFCYRGIFFFSFMVRIPKLCKFSVVDTLILLDFSLTLKAAPHGCVIRTCQP